MNLVYLAESQEVGRVGDEDTAWAWLQFAELPVQTLLGLKRHVGAGSIREMGLSTAQADTAYGTGWLDRV